MTLEDVLLELMQRLGSAGDAVLAWEQVRVWPAGATRVFEKARWIRPTVAASTVECPGCEESCFMPVHVLPARGEQPARAYVACDRRVDMGRIKIAMPQLQQWQITEGQISEWVSSALGLKGKPTKHKASGALTLGNLQGKKRLGCLEFDTDASACLKASGHSLPLSEVVFFDNDQPSIDRAAILDLVDLPPASESAEHYQRSTARLEARKVSTLERYAAWEKAYRELKRKRRGMSDVWYSQQIGKQMNANAETIRKHMKK